MGTSMVAAISVLLVVLLSTTFVARAQKNLTSDFYNESCPSVFSIVQQGVQTAVAEDKRNAASLIRVHFHDCFVNGCDASVLLDTAPGIESEKDAPANNQSLRGFEIIDSIKAALEGACPNTVSCADILAIASRDSAVELGFNNYTVLLGRNDSLTSGGVALANKFLPSPVMNYNELVLVFANVSLNVTDLVALSGAHTVGRVNCSLLTGPALFSLNNVSIDPDFQAAVTQSCAPNSSALQNLDLTTPDVFDNNYFSNLQNSKGILISDQSLYSTPGAESVAIVENFASNQEQFFAQFAASTIKMGNLNSGAEGEIRTNCRLVNSASPAQLIAYE